MAQAAVRRRYAMAVCEVCGNDYWLSFEVRTTSGDTHVFDSFECAIQRLAPVCEHCQTRIIGHGVEVSGRFFCCAHCARSADSAEGFKIRDAAGVHPG
jgi:phage terminase large subunit GpA-like protein